MMRTGDLLLTLEPQSEVDVDQQRPIPHLALGAVPFNFSLKERKW
jgi:hypothetical protein